MCRYYYLLRPPSIGCQPQGGINRETFTYFGPVEALDGMKAHGWVEYDEPLEFDQIWRFDLMPANELERAKYRLWLYADRDPERVQRWLNECAGKGIDWLSQQVDAWPPATFAMVILTQDVAKPKLNMPEMWQF